MRGLSSTVGITGLRRFSPVELAARWSIHYSRVIVGVAFLLILVSAGVRSAPGILILGLLAAAMAFNIGTAPAKGPQPAIAPA